jgi:hypothetical protein
MKDTQPRKRAKQTVNPTGGAHRGLKKERRWDCIMPSSGRKPKPKLKAAMTESAAASAQHLEMECRLRIQEAGSRWQRNKELILIGAAVFVILDTCAVSTFLIASKSASSSDRQQAFFVLGQIIAILIGVIVGKNIKWER